MSRDAWIVVAVVAAVILLSGGTVLIVAALGKREVFQQVKAAALGELAALRPDLSDAQANAAAEILAAQAVFETDGGRTIAWREGWNFGNVTSGGPALWSGPVVTGPDTEYDAAGNVKNISQAFRKYASLDDAVHDFLTVVLNWYRERQANAAGYLYAGDVVGYSHALSQAGYYTLPADQYLAGVQAQLEAYGA